MAEPRFEFVSGAELNRHASICGPGTPGAAALAEFSRILNAGRTPICIQVIDGTYPARLLVFDGVTPPAEIPEPLRAACAAVAARVGGRMARHTA